MGIGANLLSGKHFLLVGATNLIENFQAIHTSLRSSLLSAPYFGKPTPFKFKMSAVIQQKTDAIIAFLVTVSRAHFEEKLVENEAQLRKALYEKEKEMRPQTVDAKFNFSFSISVPYKTAFGPLFPPLPPPLHVPARRSYYLRQSARKPAGFYAE